MEEKIEKLEASLLGAEERIKGLFRTGQVPTAVDYGEVDRIKGQLKTARRVRAMDARRADPKLTRKISVMIPEEEYRVLLEKAAKDKKTFSKYIRDLINNAP